MKNMGLSALSLVAPGPLDEAVLLARAVHAHDVWKNARTFATLADSVIDRSLVIATTCRRGEKRKVSLRPRELARRLAEMPDARVALVFGNERTGLESGEIDLCNLASHIPVCDRFPSLNLSHAVQIYAYELFLALGEADAERPKEYEIANVKGEWIPMERAAADGLASEIAAILGELGFYRLPGREGQTRFLRDLVCRAGLTEREGRYLKGIFEKAARLGSMGGGGG